MSADPSEPSLSILLVEDHADTAHVVGSFLSIRGHVVETGNGVSLINGIRRFCKTPAIAVTGYSTDSDVERCINAGFDLHLAKPLSPAKLLEAIDTLLKEHSKDQLSISLGD